eukprot:NP_001255171.1 F-box A protein [Caenorhabditis elegans]
MLYSRRSAEDLRSEQSSKTSSSTVSCTSLGSSNISSSSRQPSNGSFRSSGSSNGSSSSSRRSSNGSSSSSGSTSDNSSSNISSSSRRSSNGSSRSSSSSSVGSMSSIASNVGSIDSFSDGSVNSNSNQQLVPNPEIILADPRALRACMTYQILQQMTSFDAYTEMCESLGTDFMEYRRLSACGVSQTFKSIIDAQCSNMTDCAVVLSKGFVELIINEAWVNYREWIDESFQAGCRLKYEDREIILPNKTPLEVAMKDLSTFMHGRELSLDSFMVTTWEEDMDLYDPLISLLHQIGSVPAKYVIIEGATSEKTAQILQHFEAGVLKKLRIRADVADAASIQPLVALDQWKSVDKLHLTCHAKQFQFFVKHLKHLKAMKVDFFGHNLSKGDMMKFRDEVIVKSSRFKVYKFKRVHYSSKELLQVLCPMESPIDSFGKIDIETDNATFSIEFDDDWFQIKKSLE